MKRKYGDFRQLGGGGGGSSLYFLKNSLATGGMQEGQITKKPDYISSYVFDNNSEFPNFVPYKLIVCASGVALIAGSDIGHVDTQTAIVAVKIQKIDTIEYISGINLSPLLDLEPQYSVFLKSGNYCYLKGTKEKSEVVKIDVSNFGDMKEDKVCEDIGANEISGMTYYEGFLIVTKVAGTPQDSDFYVIDTETMSVTNTIPGPTDQNFFDIRAIEVSGKYGFVIANRGNSTIKSLFIIDLTNIQFESKLNIISETLFTMSNRVARIVYSHDETLFITGVGEMVIINVANKEDPHVYPEFALQDTSIIYGMTTLGKYVVVGTWNLDNMITFDVTDFSAPVIVDSPLHDDVHLNAITHLKSYGPYLITIAQSASITKNISIFTSNGYYLPSLQAGTGLFEGKVYFNDETHFGQRAVFEREIEGYSAQFVSTVGAANIPKSELTVRKLEDLPPVKYIEKTGDQGAGVDSITMDPSGLEQFMQIEGEGIPEYTYITGIGAGFITISQDTTAAITGNIYKIDGHIDLEDAKDLEIKFDSNDTFLIKYYLQAPSTGSIALNTLGATRYVYAGPIGGAVRGTMAADTYIAFLSKFLVGQLWPFAQWFDIDGSQEATIFTENVVSFATPTSYFAVGRIDGVNISNQVSQFKGWSTGLATHSPDKLKPSKWSFRGGDPNLTSNVACFYIGGTLGNLADFVGCDFTPTDADPNNPHQYFFYIDPATAATAAAGTNPTELVLRGCNIKGPKNQYWFPGSATGKDVGVDVSKCQPLADSSSFYFTEIKTGLVTTDFAQDTARRLNLGAQEEISDSPIERFILNPSYNEIEYVGIQDKLHNLIIKAKLKSNSTAAISFSLCIGNRHITPVSFVLQTGTIWRVTTSAPHGLVPNDYILFEGASPIEWNNKFPVISIVNTLSFEVDVTVPGQPQSPTAVLLSRELPHSKVLHGLTTNIETKIIEGKSTLAQDSFVLVSGLNTDPVKTITCYPGTTLSAERIG
jgi:hypothetical protein